jgi:hypothetical protein
MAKHDQAGASGKSRAENLQVRFGFGSAHTVSFQRTWIYPECSGRMTKHDQASGKSRAENLQVRFRFGSAHDFF